MSASVNKAILVGNLGKDPEIRTFQNGGRVASFSIATSESWKDKATGERKERTEWHRISVMNDALIDTVEKYLKKGMKVYVEGQLETRKWTDKEGIERYATEVVLRPYRGNITMLGGGPDDNKSPERKAVRSEAEAETSAGNFIDDSIPFYP